MAYNKSYKSYKREDNVVKTSKSFLNLSIFKSSAIDYFSRVKDVFRRIKRVLLGLRKTQNVVAEVSEEDVKRFLLEIYFKDEDVEFSFSRGCANDWNVVAFDKRNYFYRYFCVDNDLILRYLNN